MRCFRPSGERRREWVRGFLWGRQRYLQMDHLTARTSASSLQGPRAALAPSEVQMSGSSPAAHRKPVFVGVLQQQCRVFKTLFGDVWADRFARCWWCQQPDEGERWKQQLYLWQGGKKLDGVLLFRVKVVEPRGHDEGIVSDSRLISHWRPRGRRRTASLHHRIQACSRQHLRHLTGNPHMRPHHNISLTGESCTILDLGSRLRATWSSQLSYFDGSSPVGLIINISSLHPVRWAIFILIFIHVTFGVINSSWDFYFWLWCLMKASSLSTSSERLVVSKTDEHDGGQQHLDKVIPAKSTRLIKTSFVLMLEHQINVGTQSFERIIPFQSCIVFFT